MEDTLLIKLLIASTGTLIGLFALGIKYIMAKINGIVTEPEVRQLIEDHTAPERARQNMIYERLIHIDSQINGIKQNFVDLLEQLLHDKTGSGRSH